jgi:hypothetical protein
MFLSEVPAWVQGILNLGHPALSLCIRLPYPMGGRYRPDRLGVDVDEIRATLRPA